MGFPGTFPGEYTIPLQNFGTQKWHYSQYLIWKQVWKPVPQFNLDQTSHLLWDTPLSSLVWFSRNNMFLWSKWNLLLVEMLLWMNSGWRKSSRIWCLHWTGWSSVPTGPSKDFHLRMKSVTPRTSQEWTSRVLARTQGCGEGVQLQFQWQLQLEYAAPALHSL